MSKLYLYSQPLQQVKDYCIQIKHLICNKELLLITQDLFWTHCPSVKVFKPNDIPKCVCSGEGRFISCGLLNCNFFLLVFISASAEVLKNCLFLVNRCCEQCSLSVMRMWCLGNMKAIRMTQLSPRTL
jgi:hypothetical protein